MKTVPLMTFPRGTRTHIASLIAVTEGRVEAACGKHRALQRGEKFKRVSFSQVSCISCMKGMA